MAERRPFPEIDRGLLAVHMQHIRDYHRLGADLHLLACTDPAYFGGVQRIHEEMRVALKLALDTFARLAPAASNLRQLGAADFPATFKVDGKDVPLAGPVNGSDRPRSDNVCSLRPLPHPALADGDSPPGAA
jgi:hypothetical protein